MSIRSLRAATLLLAAALVAAPLFAAEAASGSLSEEISVELVNVEVHVQGSDGRPVAGLPREAFRVFEAGHPVEITHFAWIPADAAGAPGESGAGAAHAAREPRTITLFVDELQVGERNRAPLVAALRSALAEHLAPDDRVSVVRFAGAELELLLPFSTNRKDLERALDELEGFSLARLTLGRELATYLDWIRDDIYNPIGKEGGTVCANVQQMVGIYSDLVRRNVEASGSALLRYAHRLAGEPGAKLVFHLSDGIPLVAGGEVQQLAFDMCGGNAAAAGVPNAVSTSVTDPSGEFQSDRYNPRAAALEGASYQMATFWTEIAARLNALGVTIYPIQAAESGDRFLPNVQGQIFPPSVHAMATQNPVDTLALLADETGGVLVRPGRGIESEVGRLMTSLGDYYSIAFAPGRENGAGRREIRVEVDRPGVTLRHRQAYRLQTRDERIASQLAVSFDVERLDNPLAVGLGTRAGAGAGEPRRLQVVVPFDRLSMVPSSEGGEEGRFTIYLALRREGGRVSNPRQKAIVARRTDSKALAFTYEVALPDEGGEVAVAVVDDFSGTVAFAREKLRAH